MAYIRRTSEGRYCDLGDGSRVYMYPEKGNRVVHYGPSPDQNSTEYIEDGIATTQELAGVVLHVFESAGADQDYLDELQRALSNEFGGVKDGVNYLKMPDPEAGEVACRIVSRILDDVELQYEKQVSDTFEPAYESCDYCGEMTRNPRGERPLACSSEECRKKRDSYTE